MKGIVANFLKAGLVGLLCLPLTLWAADSPRVKVNTDPIKPNTADIHLESVINGNNMMHVTITSGGQGCKAGQFWDVVVGGCTVPLKLRTLSKSEACSCSCGEGSTGSCTASRNGSYDVLGWRIPPSGAEQVSSYGATVWSACKTVSNSCKAETPEPSAPPSGTTYIVDAFICNESHAQYNSGPLDNSAKNRIISTYRSFNYGARCPEQGGLVYWQNQWLNWALEEQKKNPGQSLSEALSLTWTIPTQQTMRQAAKENGEDSSSYKAVLDGLCSSYGTRQYGTPVSASYINFSGSYCIVN